MDGGAEETPLIAQIMAEQEKKKKEQKKAKDERRKLRDEADKNPIANDLKPSTVSR